jgi:hypothetical protein
MTSRRITALFTLLAILIAPLCAPFCHSHICAASPSEHNDGCHSSTVARDNVWRFALTPFHICGGQELPAAALNEATNSPELVRQQYAAHPALNLAPPLSVLLALSSALPARPDGATRIESSSVLPSILRI